MFFLWWQRCSFRTWPLRAISLSLSLSLFLPLRFSLRCPPFWRVISRRFRYHVKSVRASCLSLPLPPSLSFLPALPSLTPPLPHLTLPYSPLFTAALCVALFTFYCNLHVERSVFMTNSGLSHSFSVPILSEFYQSGAISSSPTFNYLIRWIGLLIRMLERFHVVMPFIVISRVLLIRFPPFSPLPFLVFGLVLL